MAPDSREQERAATRTQEQGARSRERILDAAERLMTERGFAATSIAAIRTASGLPTSSIYWHFESKEGLLAAVMERSSLRWLEKLGDPSAYGANPRERMHAFLERAYADIESGPLEFMKLAIHLSLERSADPIVVEAVRRVRARGRALIVGIFEEVFGDLGPELAGRVAGECATLAMAIGEGMFVMRQVDPDPVGFEERVAQIETGLMAIAERMVENEDGRKIA